MNMASLLEQVVTENAVATCKGDASVTSERFGCGARDERERRACGFYLWLLGPTTEQLATSCPCKG